jgi:hypothetical protein
MTKPPAGRLRPFRLNDVPLDLRLAAAKHAHVAVLPDDVADPHDRLFAALAAPANTGLRDQLVRVARTPSERVYWIPATAWTRVMGREP